MSDGLEKLRLRLEYLGGTSPSGRIQKDKLRSFTKALTNSYQSTTIQKLSNNISYLCLINPDTVQPDYDNKVISISFDAEMRPGETFYWPINNTYWIVYLTELTEQAYYRGYVRRCRYKMTINSQDYYVYVRGPAEAGSTWSQRGNMIWNKGNQSLKCYVTKTEDSLNFFKRLNIIELDGHNWKIEAVDNMTLDGIIEVDLKEYFDNQYENLEITSSIEEVSPSVPQVSGSYYVKPYETYPYTILNSSGGSWSLSNSKAKILSQTSTSVIIEVISGRSGSFDLIYSGSPSVTQTIIIESL